MRSSREDEKKVAAEELNRQSREILAEAKEYRSRLSKLPPDDPQRESLEDFIWSLLERSKSLSQKARGMLES